ncbi:MAG: sodium:solute symporter family protein [Alphaproteobacteria bacterium]|nr:sodium:solute symporter family protein [Alphaproteobacteria bacterium]
MSGIYWEGLAAVVVLYVAVFALGVWAGKQSKGDSSAEELLLAGRSIPLWIGLLTMTATWVGGGYINGTAANTYKNGLLWGSQAGLGYAASLIVGGLFYARRMRRAGYTTLIDPLQERYGDGAAAFLMIPAVVAELFWSAAILVALGTTFGVVLGITDTTTAILISSSVAVIYTVLGGLRAVAYTDVLQMFLIILGLCLAIPFVVGAAGGVAALPAGSIVPSSGYEAASYSDYFLLLMLGGIPWNVYFQRVLSARSERAAMGLSLFASVMCALLVIPPVLVGLSARALDWHALLAGTGIDVDVLLGRWSKDASDVLPYVMRYAVPQWVGIVGLGAVSAAVMSSVDSSILSGASLVAWNGYRQLVDPEVTGEEMTRLVRILIVVLGVAATIIGLTVQSIDVLWYLCGDIVYCVLFPQLTLALFDPKVNRTGALSAFFVALVLRLGGGVEDLGLPAFLPWPEFGGAEFPVRTVAMLSGVITALVVSRLTASFDPPRPIRNTTPDPRRTA